MSRQPETGSAPVPEIISCDSARTIPGLFARRLAATPDRPAYRQFESTGWRCYSWRAVCERVACWRAGFAAEGLGAGERVAIALPSGLDWICCDLAALSLGLVTVPLYTTDSAGNMAHILEDSGAAVLVVRSAETWAELAAERERLSGLRRVVATAGGVGGDPRLRALDDWLPAQGEPGGAFPDDPDALATLVYTSGTTGPAKGVMLSHRNILSNAEAVLRRIPALPEDCFLSFLPLAHAFERTVGYYLPMMAGSSVAYARSILDLREDLRIVRPTVLLSVPRVYDKIYLAIQEKVGRRGPKRWLLDATVAIGWRRFESRAGRGPGPGFLGRLLWPLLARLVAQPVLARLGGRLRVAVSGGAPLSGTVARFFVGLGLPLTEGYGLTEASPVVTNVAPEAFIPGRVGEVLSGTEIRLGADSELLVRGPGIAGGYWRDREATATIFGSDGWLHTGDLAEIRDDGSVAIRGRLKEILVTSTGEKIPPGDMEMAMTMDPLIDQALVVGEGRPGLAALVVLARGPWALLADALGLDPRRPESLLDERVRHAVLEHITRRLCDFPGYARIRAVHPMLEPWTVENGLITPTLKVKRSALQERFAVEIDALYR